jgi:sec-independent protein translocase protein TatA
MFEGLSTAHLLIVAVIALLLFGDRLPEVMRSVGRGVMEFKKGMRGIESAMEAAALSPPASPNRTSTAQNETAARSDEVATPRFDPPTAEPRSAESQPVDVHPAGSAAIAETIPRQPGQPA